MKFKEGDVLKAITTFGELRIVLSVDQKEESYLVNRLDDTRNPYHLSAAYVEDIYELRDILESPLYKALS